MEQELAIQIEEAALNAWPAVKQMDYDGWLLRMTGGPSKRVNSVNLRGPSSLALAEKVRYCKAAYQREGLPLIFRLPEPLTSSELTAGLEGLGYHSFDPTWVLGRVVDSGSDWTGGLGFCQMSPMDFLEARAWMMDVSLASLGYQARILNLILPEKTLVCLFEDGRPAACGMGVVQGELLGYFSIYTRPSARRRGFARAVMAALSQWGHARGADFGYLQVEGDNAPALAMYQKMGFEKLYGYTYRKMMV
jgi:N-acetylglutamate synthase